MVNRHQLLDRICLNMKYFVVFVLAALAVSAYASEEELKAKIKENVAECTTSTGVDVTLIGKVRSHEYTGRDPKLAKYYCCMLNKMGMIKEDGQFNQEVMVEKLPTNPQRDTAVKAVKKCAVHEDGVSDDDTCMNFIYCFYKQVGKEYKFY